MMIDKPILEGSGYVIGECNCCHEKDTRVYFLSVDMVNMEKNYLLINYVEDVGWNWKII